MKSKKKDLPSASPEAVEAIVLLMVSGVSAKELPGVCVEKLKLKPAQVAGAIARAKRMITTAADYDRDEQIGIAVTRLNDLYSLAYKDNDKKTATHIQKELNKLLNLYHAPAADPQGGAHDEEIASARKYLAPLFDGGDSLPLSELCRLAAGRLMKK